MQESYRRLGDCVKRPGGNHRRIDAALSEWLAGLDDEALEHIDRLGGTRGAICFAQRPWSRLLDLLAAEWEAA